MSSEGETIETTCFVLTKISLHRSLFDVNCFGLIDASHWCEWFFRFGSMYLLTRESIRRGNGKLQFLMILVHFFVYLLTK